MWELLLKSPSLSRVLDRGTDTSPNLTYCCIYGSSVWASAMVLPREPSKARGRLAYGNGIEVSRMPLKAFICVWIVLIIIPLLYICSLDSQRLKRLVLSIRGL